MMMMMLLLLPGMCSERVDSVLVRRSPKFVHLGVQLAFRLNPAVVDVQASPGSLEIILRASVLRLLYPGCCCCCCCSANHSASVNHQFSLSRAQVKINSSRERQHPRRQRRRLFAVHKEIQLYRSIALPRDSIRGQLICRKLAKFNSTFAVVIFYFVRHHHQRRPRKNQFQSKQSGFD